MAPAPTADPTGQARRPPRPPPSRELHRRDVLRGPQRLRLAAAPTRPAARADRLPLLATVAARRTLGAAPPRAARAGAPAPRPRPDRHRGDHRQPKHQDHRSGAGTATTAPRTQAAATATCWRTLTGVLLRVRVTAADVGDRDGATVLLHDARTAFPRLSVPVSTCGRSVLPQMS